MEIELVVIRLCRFFFLKFVYIYILFKGILIKWMFDFDIMIEVC